MARNLFGGSSDDYAVDSTGRPIAVRRVRFYTSAAMTTEITDLASDAAGTGAPLTVNTDAHGFWGPVYGPDGVTTMYAGTVDSGGNPPAYVVAIYTHTSGGVASFNTRAGAVSLTKADVTATALAAADVGAPNVVVHGSTAGTARPSGATVVHWIGSVAPTNVTGNDEWTDTTNKLLKRWNGTSFDALGSAAYMGLASGRQQRPLPALIQTQSLVAMASPPTITLGADNAGPTLSTQNEAASLNAHFLSADYTTTTVGGWPNSLVAQTLTTPSPTWLTRFELETDAATIEVAVNTNSSANLYRLWVDGQPVSVTGTQINSGGPSTWVKIAFGSRRVRRILWESTYTGLIGIWAASTDTFWKAPTRNRPKVAALGDSYSEGATDWLFNAWEFVAGRLLDWNVYGCGVGGTGILNPGSAGHVKYRDRVAADVIAHNPDIVLIQGTSNDEAFTTGLQTETAALIAAITAGLPNAQLAFVGPFKPFVITSTGNPTVVRDAYQAACAAAGVPFIDPIKYPASGGWITGTGKVGATAGNGNADIYTNTDGTHYTQAGYEYVGRRFAGELRALGVGF